MSGQSQEKAGFAGNEPLWSPDAEQIEKSRLTAFMNRVSDKTGKEFSDYRAISKWSTDHSEEFWSEIWDFCGIIGEKGTVVLKDGDKMPGAQFFPDAKINFAENLLRRRDDHPALIFRDETGGERSLTFNQLYDEVSKWQQAFKEAGIEKGDRVSGYMPNMPESIIAMLAATSLGAVWSSASPDFGVNGVVDRFGQTEPKILVTVDGYHYNGKKLDILPKVKEIQPQIKSLEKTIIVPFLNDDPDLSGMNQTITAGDFTASFASQDIEFNRVDFNEPLFIMFSSGTTGAPKCIVHGHGGTLMQNLNEHQMNCDMKPDERLFYFTTCGWMMWNWLVVGLANETTLLLYDGSPFYPDGNVLWDFTTKHDCKLFGTSAKYIDALKANQVYPGETHDLSALKLITSTGSPLVPESFDFVYEKIKKDVQLAPIYGGTDIICAAFGIGNPISPVWRGEMQGQALGTCIDIFDEDGHSIPPGGGAGELVLTKPIPSMPVGFWNDTNGEKYHDAYFDMFPDVWRHGDWAELTSHGGVIVTGRSDATLNPGGVRIGTSEITGPADQTDGVKESMAIGQDWEGDVRVVLFVIFQDGVALNEDMEKTIKGNIRKDGSPRHVPAKIIPVKDFPRTRSGKVSELSVKNILHNRPVKNVEALANPESLALFKDLPQLQEGYSEKQKTSSPAVGV